MSGPEYTKSDGIDLLLMSCLEAGMGWLNDAHQKTAYREMFDWIREHRDTQVFSFRYPGGHTGYVRDPKGVLIQETWNHPSGAGFPAFRGARIYGFGSTPGSALIQGRAHPVFATAPEIGEHQKYLFFDLRRMRLLGSDSYWPERYRLDRATNLLERIMD